MKIQKLITFDAKDETEGKEIIDSALTLISKLSTEDLKQLAELTKNKPGWTKKAMQYKHLL